MGSQLTGARARGGLGLRHAGSWALLAGFGLAAGAVSPSGLAAEVAIGEGGGFEISSGERRFSVGGRLRIDGAYFEEDTTEIPAGIEAFQALLMFQGQMNDDWGFSLAYEFVSEVPFNLYIERRNLPFGDIRVGQFRPQVGLFPGGAWIPFNHRSMVEQALTLPRLVGVDVQNSIGRVTYSAAVSGDQVGRDSVGDDPLRYSGRLVVRVGPDAEAPMQVGLSAVHRQIDDTGRARFDADFGATLDDTPTLLEGEVSGSNYFRVYAAEGLWMRGPLSLQAEYMQADVHAPGSPTVDGWYAQAMFFPTGDTRRYSLDNATIGRPILADAARGAWEVGLRLESLDLTEVGGGEATNVALAINRYFSNPMRLTTTLTHADIENGVNGDEKIVSVHLRLQWFL